MFGYEVTQAESGEQAVSLLKELGDLFAVVSDLEMGGMSGVELLQTVRNMRSQTFRVLMSGRFSDSDFAEEKKAESGAHLILPKPIRLEQWRGLKTTLLNLPQEEH